jgi:hypothetical protein
MSLIPGSSELFLYALPGAFTAQRNSPRGRAPCLRRGSVCGGIRAKNKIV